MTLSLCHQHHYETYPGKAINRDGFRVGTYSSFGRDTAKARTHERSLRKNCALSNRLAGRAGIAHKAFPSVTSVMKISDHPAEPTLFKKGVGRIKH